MFSLAQWAFGHHHAIQVADTQPAKLAAFEGLFETQTNAPLLLFGLPNEELGRTDYEVAIPGLLSFLIDMSFDREVQGLNDFPREQWPPVLVTFVTFHLMFLLGVFFIGFSVVGVFLLWRKKILNGNQSFISKWFLRIAVLAMPLPIAANILGWFTAEFGRQPWLVYEHLLTRDGVSPLVPAGHLVASLVMFILIYAVLFAVWIFTLRGKFLAGPKAIEETASEVGA